MNTAEAKKQIQIMVHNLTHNELRNLCRSRLIKVSGAKAILAKRLYGDGYRHQLNQDSELSIQSDEELTDDDAMDIAINALDDNNRNHNHNHNNYHNHNHNNDENLDNDDNNDNNDIQMHENDRNVDISELNDMVLHVDICGVDMIRAKDGKVLPMGTQQLRRCLFRNNERIIALNDGLRNVLIDQLENSGYRYNDEMKEKIHVTSRVINEPNKPVRYRPIGSNTSKQRWIRGQRSILTKRINGSLKQMDGAGILILIDMESDKTRIGVRTAWCGRMATTMDQSEEAATEFHAATRKLITSWKNEDDKRKGTHLKKKASVCEEIQDGLNELAADKENLSRTEYDARCRDLVYMQMLLLNKSSEDVDIEMNLIGANLSDDDEEDEDY